ncbi:MAG: DUF1045 domain-containing protein [Leucobacter sp.]
MTRFAVYALPGALGDADAPEAVELWGAAEAWYARDEFHDLTVDARRYGFHATLKAPFHLAKGTSEGELRAAADAFASARRPVIIQAPAPGQLGGFRALVPHGDATALADLAASAVREFDGFRAPLTELEVRRRRPERMSARERELFEQWGYPYVLDQFHFHMTLTDPVPISRSSEVDAALAEHFAATAGVDVPLRAIALFTEREPGAPFTVHSVHPFARSLQEDS